MSSLEKFASALTGALPGKSPGSDNLRIVETMCSSLSPISVARKTPVNCRDGADDEDDPPYVTGLDDVVMWKPRVERVLLWVQQILLFFMSASALKAGRGILPCACLTRRLRETSEDMALMIRVLHYSV